jgi:hypothetical protein
MYGVIAQVRIDPEDQHEAGDVILDVVMPRAEQLSGLAGRNWLQALDGDRGTAVLLFESEAAARAAAEGIRSQGPLVGNRVELEAVAAYELVTQA